MSNIVNELTEIMCAYRKWHVENVSASEGYWCYDWQTVPTTEPGRLFLQARKLIWANGTATLPYFEKCHPIDFFLIVCKTDLLCETHSFYENMVAFANEKAGEDDRFPTADVVERLLLMDSLCESLTDPEERDAFFRSFDMPS